MALPRYLEPDDPCEFPDPRQAEGEGLVAVGGDLSPGRLRAAYQSGVFPWYDAAVPPLWWSPDPRAILDPSTLHVARSLRRTQNRRCFELTWNRAFRRVMLACAEARSDGTWILPEMVVAYSALHAEGDAHSLEVWQDGELAGGIYGVQRGALFAAESMFHRVDDASKVALVAAVQTLFAAGVELFDVQFVTPHLETLGAFTITRDDYLARLADVVGKKVDLTAPEMRLDLDQR